MTELEKDVEEQEAINHWNAKGFEEISKAVNNLRRYSKEYPRDYGDFKMKVKQTDETERLIIIIEVVK